MIRTYFFISLLCFSFVKLMAQTPEQIQVHFDKSFYVAGEDAWYKLYFQETAENIKSKVVRVEWVAPDGSIALQQKLKITGNYAVGDLAIPYNWKEGNYHFRAYTLWNLNFEETASFHKVIPIYNLLETPQVLAQKEAAEAVLSTELESELKIELSTSQKMTKRRAGIVLTVKMTDKAGNPISGQFSIVVRDENYFPNTDQVDEGVLLPKNKKIVGTFSGLYEAEQSIQLIGELKNAQEELLDTRFLSLFFPEQGIFKQTTINKGRLDLPIADFTGMQSIQLFDMNPFHEPIPQVKLASHQLKTIAKSEPLVRSESVAHYLFLLSKYRQYRETFQQNNPDYGIAPTLKKISWEADQSYQMEKYKGLSDMASFVKEIISGGRVVNAKGKKSIRLRYAEKSTFNRLSPWYMVNGWLTDDEPLVLKLPFREIEQIEVFNSKAQIAKQLDASMVSRGLITITTKDGKTPDAIIKKANNQKITGFYATRQFPTRQLTDSKSPDFRPVIYWNPIVKTDANGVATISIISSDAIGKGQIQVVGMDENGRMGWNTLIYETVFE